MGYQTEYIIDPEVQDEEQPMVQKEMEPISIPNNKINRDYEIIDEPVEPTKSVLDEIHETAVAEGLVDEDEEDDEWDDEDECYSDDEDEDGDWDD